MIFRLGRIRDDEAKGPGIFFLLPCIDKFLPVDVRTKSFDVPPQKVRDVETKVEQWSARKLEMFLKSITSG